MALNQIHKYRSEGGVFAASWLAATLGIKSLYKYYNDRDIAAIDIKSTCDEIYSAFLSSTTLTLNYNNHNNNNNNCNENNWMAEDGNKELDNILQHTTNASLLSHLPFRVLSNLCLGTIRIYREQVNQLLKFTMDLNQKSFEVHLPKVNKKQNRTRKLTRRSKEYLPSNEYTELLDDLQKLVDESRNANNTSVLDEGDHLINPENYTQSHYRSITINDIAITNNIIDATNLVYESQEGFGAATDDEILQFINFFKNNSNDNHQIHLNGKEIGKQRKRKNYIDENNCLKKSRRSQDKEPLHKRLQKELFHRRSTLRESQQQQLNETFLSQDHSVNSRDDNCEMKANQINGRHTRLRFSNNLKQQQITCENSQDHRIRTDNVLPTATIEIKNEQISKDYNDIGRLNSKVIFDKSIKLNTKYIREQMKRNEKTYWDFCKKSKIKSNLNMKMKIIPKKSSLKKIWIPASKLLTGFNRSFSYLTSQPKPKTIIDPKKIHKEYENLVRSILQTNFQTEYLQEIRAKVQNQPNPSLFIKSRVSSLTSTPPPPPSTPHSLRCTATPATSDLQDISHKQCELENNLSRKTNNQIINLNKWRASAVLRKLLDLSRLSTQSHIDAKEFCNSAKNNICKATTFASLMILVAKRLIGISRIKYTIEMDKIILRKFKRYSIRCKSTLQVKQL